MMYLEIKYRIKLKETASEAISSNQPKIGYFLAFRMSISRIKFDKIENFSALYFHEVLSLIITM